MNLRIGPKRNDFPCCEAQNEQCATAKEKEQFSRIRGESDRTGKEIYFMPHLDVQILPFKI